MKLSKRWSFTLFLLVVLALKVSLTPSITVVDAQSSKDVSEVRINQLTVEQIENYVNQEAVIYGVPIDRADWIGQHESQWNPKTIGDDQLICPVGINKGKIEHSRGLWQISDCYHPEVSNAVAMNIVSSTLWAMPNLKKDPNMWSTWLYRFKWFTKQNPPLN